MSFVLKAAVGEPAQRASNPAVVDTVAGVIADIRANGDDAVRKYSDRFDRWSPDSFRLDEDQIREIVKSVPTTVLEDLQFAQRQIRDFAQAQRDTITDLEVETLRRVLGAPEHSDRRGCSLRSGRQVPADSVGAHDGADREGRRRRTRRGYDAPE